MSRQVEQLSSFFPRLAGASFSFSRRGLLPILTLSLHICSSWYLLRMLRMRSSIFFSTLSSLRLTSILRSFSLTSLAWSV